METFVTILVRFNSSVVVNSTLKLQHNLYAVLHSFETIFILLGLSLGRRIKRIKDNGQKMQDEERHKRSYILSNAPLV